MTLIAASQLPVRYCTDAEKRETAVPTTSGGGQNVEAAERAGKLLNLQLHQIRLNGQNTASYSWITLPRLQRKYVGEVLAASSLGSAADTAQMIQMGTLDFNLNDDMSIDGILDGKLICMASGLVSDYDEADQYYNMRDGLQTRLQRSWKRTT